MSIGISPPPGRLLCFGDVLLRLTAPAGHLLSDAAALGVHVGGSEANVAAALAQLGHRAAMVTALPEGPLGALAERALRRHGVDLSEVSRAQGRLGLYFLEPGAGPRPSRIVYDREGSLFSQSAGAFDWPRLLTGAAWLHASGITAALGESGAAGLQAAAEAARAHGVNFSLDCNYRPSLWIGREAEAPRILAAVASQADLIFGSRRDIALLTGADAAGAGEAAQAAFQAFPSLHAFISTDRRIEANGAHLLSARLDLRDRSVEAEAVQIDGSLDRIGSGDAFVAAVIDGIVSGLDPERLLARGLAAAAIKQTIAGDQWIGCAADLDDFEQLRGSDVRR